MGFRYSNRIKILPGLTLNLSGSGVSASVGVRGARVTFGESGTFGNVGIPGSGLSYRTRLDGGTRRKSSREIDAAYRRSENQLTKEVAEKTVADSVESHQKLLDSWRNLPCIPTFEGFRTACFEAAFHFDEPLPQCPDWEAVAKALRTQLREECERASKRNAFRFGLLTVGGLLAVVFWKQHLIWPLIILPFTIFATKVWLERFVTKKVQMKTQDALQRCWPDNYNRLSGVYAVLLQEYEVRRAAAESDWKASETSRAEWARRLFYGDLAALQETFNATFSEIPFPFDTTCEASFNDAHKVFLRLDLPEIEDIVETSVKKVLRDGRVKEIKRHAVDMNVEYSRLACGLGVLAACEAFTCGPTIQLVEVAAFTKRTKRPGLPPVDCYIYNFEMQRGQAITEQLEACEPVAQIHAWGGKIDPDRTGKLKEISIPAWCNVTP